MKKQHTSKIVAVAALALAGAGLLGTARADVSVQVNGETLQTSVPPMRMHGRTMVPMRDIFEALGAEVHWRERNQEITATRGATRIWLQIGNHVSMVDGQRQPLDQAPIIYDGSTMVPLRFVSEALGANVDWNPRMETVNIDTHRGRHMDRDDHDADHRHDRDHDHDHDHDNDMTH